jgi:hypothetical protein
MEYLWVEFHEDRLLVIDDAPTWWRTNENVPIEAGPHNVSLVTPVDFTPQQIYVVVTGTSVDCPQRIKFTKSCVATA